MASELGVQRTSKDHYFDIADIRILLNFIEKCLWRDTVEVEHGQSMATSHIAAEAHAGDVYIVLAH
jgi:hypothetical protein